MIHVVREPVTPEQIAGCNAPHTPPVLHPDLAAMQREVLAWQDHWPLDQARPLLALRARQMSEALLRMAGLTGTTQWTNS